MRRTVIKQSPFKLAVKDYIRLIDEYFVPVKDRKPQPRRLFGLLREKPNHQKTSNVEYWKLIKNAHWKECQPKTTHLEFHACNYGYETPRQTDERKEIRTKENNRNDSTK